MHRCMKMETLNGKIPLWEAIRVSRMTASYLIWNRQKSILDQSRLDLRITGHPELDGLCTRLMPFAINRIAISVGNPQPLVILNSAETSTTFSDRRPIIVNHISKTCTCRTYVDYGLLCRHLLHVVQHHNISVEEISIPARWNRSNNGALSVNFAYLETPRSGTRVHGINLNQGIEALCRLHRIMEPAYFQLFLRSFLNFVNRAGPRDLPPFQLSMPGDTNLEPEETGLEQLPAETYISLDAPVLQPSQISELDNSITLTQNTSQSEETIPALDPNFRNVVAVYDARHHQRTQPQPSTSATTSNAPVLQHIVIEDNICAECGLEDPEEHEGRIVHWEQCPYCGRWYHLSCLIQPPIVTVKWCFFCEQIFD